MSQINEDEHTKRPDGMDTQQGRQVYDITRQCLCSIAATQKAAQAKITVEDQIKAIQEAQELL